VKHKDQMSDYITNFPASYERRFLLD